MYGMWQLLQYRFAMLTRLYLPEWYMQGMPRSRRSMWRFFNNNHWPLLCSGIWMHRGFHRYM